MCYKNIIFCIKDVFSLLCWFKGLPIAYFFGSLPVFKKLFMASIFTLHFEWSKKTEGLNALPLSLHSKCRWAVVARPVRPVRAMTCPAFTFSPTS